MILHADSDDWSDRADVQADLSLRLGYKSFCWFCHAAAHFVFSEKHVVIILAAPCYIVATEIDFKLFP